MSARKKDTYSFTADDSEMLRKSKMTRIKLIVALVILVLVLGGLGYLSFYFYQEATVAQQRPVKPQTNIEGDAVTDVKAPKTIEYKKTTVPDLITLFGLSVEEVQAQLGDSFQLVRLESSTDTSNPEITQLAVFSYVPEIINDYDGDMSMVIMPSEAIYASLNGDGIVIDIYYLCDMLLLDYPNVSFESLLSGDWLVLTTLQSAGVDPRDFVYELPNFDDCIVYDNVNSENRKVTKQSQIFSGRTTSEEIPTVWTLTVTYDFASGVESPDEFGEAVRTIHLKLA